MVAMNLGLGLYMLGLSITCSLTLAGPRIWYPHLVPKGRGGGGTEPPSPKLCNGKFNQNKILTVGTYGLEGLCEKILFI